MQNESLISYQSQIALRQKYYFEGKDHEEKEAYSEAIESYTTYSKHLKKEDQHIPHVWISILHSKLGNEEAALNHLEIYAQGCTEIKAAEVYKSLGEKYQSLNNNEKALEAYKKAIELNANIGVKKRIDTLNNL